METTKTPTINDRTAVCGCFYTICHVNETTCEFLRRTFASYIDLLDYATELKDLDVPFDCYIHLYFEDGSNDIRKFILF